jgi:hypothetical protein
MFILLLAMNFKLDFSDEQCTKLLEKAGYIIETVTLYYNPDTDPYENDLNESELRGLNLKVAYPTNNKPKVLCKDKPLISECLDYMYYKVVEKTINDKLYSMIAGLIDSPN